MRYEKVHTNEGMVKIVGLNEEIKEARRDLGMSRQRASFYCGVSEVTFLRWESGSTKSIKEENYNKLVDILNRECNA